MDNALPCPCCNNGYLFTHRVKSHKGFHDALLGENINTFNSLQVIDLIICMQFVFIGKKDTGPATEGFHDWGISIHKV